MNLGMGVLLYRLFGDQETPKALNGAIGKEIAALGIQDDALVFTFTDGTGLKLFDDGQTCCEHRYMHTDDALDDFVGATLMSTEIQDGPDEDGQYGDVTESQFLIVTTSAGQFTVVNYNEHNGYYGGFAIAARTIED